MKYVFMQWFVVAACFAAAVTITVVRAEDDDEGGRRSVPVQNKSYQAECATCHKPYFPGLLPAQSWEKIMTGMKAHFGENVELKAAAQADILAFLKKNAAEKSSSELSQKIMRSLHGTIPARITEIPLIKKKHLGIPKGVLQRKAIGSLANCTACHPAADKGDFDEDHTRIPGADGKRKE